MTLSPDALHQKFYAACLWIAPLLMGASTFFWKEGEYGVTGGTLLTLSMVFWIPALFALFGLLKAEMPYYYPLGLLLAVYGCAVGGTGFGFLGFFSTVFGISHEAYIESLSHHALGANLMLFWSGPLFPLSLLVLGINLARKRVVPLWAAVLLALGGVFFPISRIPRIDWMAHLADLFFLLPLLAIGYGWMRSAGEPVKSGAPV